jgi:Fe-Mn family superoxide dismutase
VQYQNLRPKYLEAIWSVINFSEAEKRLTEAQKKAQL